MGKVRYLRIRHLIALDVISITGAFVASLLLRFEGHPHAWDCLVTNLDILAWSLAIRIPVYGWLGLYRCVWRYASVLEMTTIAIAATLSSALLSLVNWGLLPAFHLAYCTSRAVILIDWLLNLIALAGIRLALRWMQDPAASRQIHSPGGLLRDPRAVLIAGAGSTGAAIAREMRANPDLGFFPIGFVDDDPRKQGRRIHGVPVLGMVHDIPELALHGSIGEVIIAVPTAPGSVVRTIKSACTAARLPSRTIPSVPELLDGKVTVQQLREVRIEDLLRRKPAVIDQAGIRAKVAGECVLVTGAGGSIGSELCRQLARYEPGRLLLLGHGEGSIFSIEQELRRRFPGVPLVPVIADVRDGKHLDRVIELHRPSLVIHAAAHKHVPLMECNVGEAFTNNVLGTRQVLRAAERHGVERFVLISTDKAVNPTSIMGATKRVAEMLVHDTALRTGRPYVAVRFGNVLGSRGSAIPIFKAQIAAGGPVTITHPEMRRYFMTIPEAVQLVLQAATLGQGGETFMLNMGEPVKMVDLARDLIELSGLAPGEDIEIVYTGMRPGEKLYEELVMDSEHYCPTPHEEIFVCRRSLEPRFGSEELEREIDRIAGLVTEMDRDQVIAGLHRLVPGLQHASLREGAGAPVAAR